MSPKSLNALALPLVFSFTFRFLFTLVDLVFVRTIKEESPHGVAAIGLFIPIQTVFIALWVGLSAGFTATLSQAFGRRDQARVAALKRGMIWINVGLVPVLFALGLGVYLFAPRLDLEPSLHRDFLTYALILILSMPFSGFLSIYPDSIVKAHHDTVSTMKAGIYSTLTNVSLNALFVFVFHWGMAGIAIATCLSRFAGIGYAAWRVRALEAERLTPDWDRGASAWDRRPLLDILTLGLPGALAYSLIFAEEAVATSLMVSTEQKETYLAAFTVYSRITALAIMPAVATAVAVLPFVARRVEENARDLVRADLRESLQRTALLVMAIAIPAGWIFPTQIAGFLVDGKDTAQAGDSVVWYLALIPITALASLPFLLLRPVFEAVGRPRLGIQVTAIKSLACGIPGSVAGFFLADSLAQDPLLGMLIGGVVGQAIASLVTVVISRRLLAPVASDAPA